MMPSFFLGQDPRRARFTGFRDSTPDILRRFTSWFTLGKLAAFA